LTDTTIDVDCVLDRDILRMMLLLLDHIVTSMLVRDTLTPTGVSLVFVRATVLVALLPKPWPITLKKTAPVAANVALLDAFTRRGAAYVNACVLEPATFWTEICAGKATAAEPKLGILSAATLESLVQRVPHTAVAPSRALWLELPPYKLPNTATAVCPVLGAECDPTLLTTMGRNAGRASPDLISKGVPLAT